jgi:hypothetical protein
MQSHVQIFLPEWTVLKDCGTKLQELWRLHVTAYEEAAKIRSLAPFDKPIEL